MHWRGLDPEVHLGYRKGKRGGVWIVRWRHGQGYQQKRIGTADDTIREGTLDYDAATKAARTMVEIARRDAEATAAGPALTVRSAIAAYVAMRDQRDSRRAGREKRSDAHQRLAKYVTGQPSRGRSKEVPASPLADTQLHELSEKHLQTWRNALPDSIKATTRQRLFNDLKAALNAAYTSARHRLPPSLPDTIKHGLRSAEGAEDAEPVARDNQILSDGDIGRLLKAAREVDAEHNWEGDLFRMVLLLAATGARFSQIARLTVGDCQIGAGRLIVPASRKGRTAKVGTITVPIGRDVIDELVPVVTGRPSDAALLERWRNEQVKGEIRWQRAGRGSWQSAAELVRPWQAIRERAGLPDVIPYALRHSNIVKGIRANLPIRLVAALHDTSTAMIERHYAKWITTGLEEMARAAIIPLVPSISGGNMVRITSKGGR